MTPDEFAALLQWLYADDDGQRWLAKGAADLRLNTRNLRAMLTGRQAIPDTIADTLCLLVAAHARLNGWAERVHGLLDLPLSATTRARLDQWRTLTT